MANLSYDFLDDQREQGNYKNSVGFFSLKNDGDDALVRILHNSVDDFDMLSCHTLEMDGKFKKINCLRGAREPVNKCPLCEAQVGKLTQKIFIHLIQYTKDEQGNIVALPKIWERSISYARTLKGLIDEYGPLERCIFKIRRQGTRGDMQTTYSILFQNPSIYPEDKFPIDKSAFEHYSALGTFVMNKSYEDCVSFVREGKFPETQTSTQNADWGAPPTPTQFQQAQPVVNPYINPSVPVEPSVTNAPTGGMPWDTGSSFSAPRRYN